MALDDEIYDADALEKQPRQIELWELKYAGRNRKFQSFLRDGIKLEGRLGIFKGVPILRIGYIGDDFFGYHEIFLTHEAERFIFSYLLTGNSKEIPKLDLEYKDIASWADESYVYKHLKREAERNVLLTWTEYEKGITVLAPYPYGSIEYSIPKHSDKELEATLETIEPFPNFDPEQDIPVLDNHTLPIEAKYLKEGDHLDSVLPEIPTNTIINKTVCGCGATWLEITNKKRNSIIIEPNVPVIIGKEHKHKNLIGVYGDKITAEEIAERIKAQKSEVKIMTTPDSYNNKVKKALKLLGTPYLVTWFMLFDECEKIVSDIDFRQNMTLPIDDFFKFHNKAMVSATPIVVNDPRFEEQEFKTIKIKPLYDHRQLLELKHTNNVSLMFKRTLEELDDDSVVCVFYNSPSGIIDMIDTLKIGDKSNIYCSTEAQKKIDKDGYHVFDTIAVENGKPVLNKYNFFTSRFYSAVDIELDYKPTVIMVTNAHKGTYKIKDKKVRTANKNTEKNTSYSLIDPETEAIQIAGRFRNGIDKLTHITDTNSELEYKEKANLEQFLNEQHIGYHSLLKLKNDAQTDGEKHIIGEAIENTEYKSQGYVTDKGEINHFRYNNAYLDERLKMIYRYPATLYKSYMRSEAFIVYSDSEYAIYTEQERSYLLNKNNSKRKRIALLHGVLKKIEDFNNLYDPKFITELKKEYSLYIEALQYLDLRKIKELEFKDSAVKTELKKAKRIRQLSDDKVIKEVYKAFKPNTNYSTDDVNTKLKPILNKYGIYYDGRGTAGDILLYFYGGYKRGTAGAGRWALTNKKFY